MKGSQRVNFSGFNVAHENGNVSHLLEQFIQRPDQCPLAECAEDLSAPELITES